MVPGTGQRETHTVLGWHSVDRSAWRIASISASERVVSGPGQPAKQFEFLDGQWTVNSRFSYSFQDAPVPLISGTTICRDCGAAVSVTAPACASCGAPRWLPFEGASPALVEQRRQTEAIQRVRWTIFGGVLFLAGFFLWLLSQYTY